MLRRPLTRLELKLEDINEYERAQLEEQKKTTEKANVTEQEPKSRTEVIHQRIGYDPTSKPGSSNTSTKS